MPIIKNQSSAALKPNSLGLLAYSPTLESPKSTFINQDAPERFFEEEHQELEGNDAPEEFEPDHSPQKARIKREKIHVSKYHDKGKWDFENVSRYGRIHTLSLESANEVGYEKALILHHLYYLQNLTPRGGHIPRTESGKRCSFNSYDQLHQRLPFLSLRALKKYVKDLQSLDGFRKFHVKGVRENHFHISDTLATRLDLGLRGKKLYFHEKEASHHGILKAILLAWISYSNAALAKPMKQPHYCDPLKSHARFGVCKRTVRRAINDLGNLSGLDMKLLSITSDKGYVICQFTRQMWMEYCEDPGIEATKDALERTQTCTNRGTDSHPPQQNVHTHTPPIDSQVIDIVCNINHSSPLSKLPNTESTRMSEIACAATLSLVPVVSRAYTVIQDKWIEFDGKMPLEASPGMEETITEHHTTSMSSSEAERDKNSLARHDFILVDSSTDAQVAKVEPHQESDEISVHSLNTSKAFSPAFDSQSQFSSAYLPVYEQKVCPTDTETPLLSEFNRLFHSLDIFPSENGSANFIEELRNNREIGLAEIRTVFDRIRIAEVFHMDQRYANQFNPYYHSCRLITANQVISKFYLILQEAYQVDTKEYFARKSRSSKFNVLREDTPAHVRSYVLRKIAEKQKRDLN